MRLTRLLLLFVLLGATSCAGGGSSTLLLLLVLGGLAACQTGASEPLEGGEPDAAAQVDLGDGTWDPCCQGGQISTCFCPAGAACNYGWFTDCGDGTCQLGSSFSDAGACVPDGGAPDIASARDSGEDGTWEPCCRDQQITTCFCPAGVACNYGWFTDCGDGVCIDPNEECPR